MELTNDAYRGITTVYTVDHQDLQGTGTTTPNEQLKSTNIRHPSQNAYIQLPILTVQTPKKTKNAYT